MNLAGNDDENAVKMAKIIDENAMKMVKNIDENAVGKFIKP